MASAAKNLILESNKPAFFLVNNVHVKHSVEGWFQFGFIE